jgi:uncharacterized protein YeaO (DUF488 family)
VSLPRIKRIYDPPAAEDGCRVLVDRLWPRGISKGRAAVDKWFREIAPSTTLRKWYRHDATKWDEFRRRYFQELDDQQAVVEELLELCAAGSVTLLFSSRERELNNAVALRDYLQMRMDEVAD